MEKGYWPSCDCPWQNSDRVRIFPGLRCHGSAQPWDFQALGPDRLPGAPGKNGPGLKGGLSPASSPWPLPQGQTLNSTRRRFGQRLVNHTCQMRPDLGASRLKRRGGFKTMRGRDGFQRVETTGWGIPAFSSCLVFSHIYSYLFILNFRFSVYFEAPNRFHETVRIHGISHTLFPVVCRGTVMFGLLKGKTTIAFARRSTRKTYPCDSVRGILNLSWISFLGW